MSGPGAASVVVDLAAVLGVAGLVSVAARALALPGVVGYLVAGMLVGPNLPVPIYADQERIHALAALGVILVMFCVGLEFRVAHLLKVLPLSGLAGLIQIATLSWAGYSVGTLLDWGMVGSAFLGASLAISSTMVVTGVFAQRPPAADVRDHTLGILVLQDVAAIVLITALTVVASGGSLAPVDLALTSLRLIATLLGLLAAGALLVPRVVRALVRAGWGESLTVLIVGFSFAYAVLAASLGYSEALGAFVAGVAVAESGEGHRVIERIGPLRDVFAAIFFVSIGMTVDPALVWAHGPLVLLIAALVIVGQLLSVTFGSLISGLPLQVAVGSALALGQIGEFSFILAEVGRRHGVVPPALGPVLVAVATLTAVTSPIALRHAARVTRWADHAIPGRVHRLLTLHRRASAQIRALAGPELSDWRRTLGGLLLDGAGLMLVGVALASGTSAAANWAARSFQLPVATSRAAIVGLGLAIAAPLVVVALINARRLAELAVKVIGGEAAHASTSGVAGLVRAVVHLLVVLALGVPAMALLRPWLTATWSAPVFMAAVLLAALLVWRRAGSVDSSLRSGVERLASWVSDGAGGPLPAAAATPIAFDAAALGLDRLPRLKLAADGPTLGLSLAELDLRARTGVVVVGILRGEGLVPMPDARESLHPGDELILLGEADCADRVRAALTGDAAAAAERVDTASAEHQTIRPSA